MTIRARVQELEKQLKELKQEIAKQDKKEHKSLSDYRCYEELKYGEDYTFITTANKVESNSWDDNNAEREFLSVGNIYSIDTPNELLEREKKKRQLWFELEKHLKENNCLASNEDWKDTNMIKYYVCYNCNANEYTLDTWYHLKVNTIFSTNKEVLKNYMNTLSEEDIKIMFDVE